MGATTKTTGFPRTAMSFVKPRLDQRQTTNSMRARTGNDLRAAVVLSVMNRSEGLRQRYLLLKKMGTKRRTGKVYP